MADPGPFRHLSQVEAGRLQALANEFHRIHAATLRQNIAERNRQYFFGASRQDIAVQNDPKNYRRVLSENLQRCLDSNPKKTRDTLGAVYLDGPKKGKKVAPRTITNMIDRTGPSPSLDVLAAVAHAFGEMMPWQLLVPGLDPNNPPIMRLTDDERKLYEEFQKLKDKLNATGGGP